MVVEEFNPSIPPKEQSWNAVPKSEVKFLHDNYDYREKFYVRILTPTGHARFNGETWDFSDEFTSALKTKSGRQSIKALFNITL